MKGFLCRAVQHDVALMPGKIFPGISSSLDLRGKSAERRLRHAQARHRLCQRAGRPPVRGPLSPVWPDGKKHARNVYAHTREECEEKLKELIVQMKKEIAKEKKKGTPAKSKKLNKGTEAESSLHFRAFRLL